MKKLTLFFALLLGMFLFPSVETHAAEPRVMAYDLHLDMSTTGFVKFCYTLNTDAEKVYIIMYAPNGEVAWRRDITSNTRKKKGPQSWTWSQFDLPSFKGMTWAIEAQGAAVSTLACTNDVSGSTTKYKFNRPQGVAVDNNPESDFFGRMYITLPKGGYDHKTGLVVFDPIHNVLSNSGITATGIELTSDDTYGMHRVAVNPTNNKVYYTKTFANNTAIYELTPDATNILSDGGTAKDIISGLGFTRADGICFDENGTLFVMDYARYSSGSQGDIYKVKGNEKTLFCENIGANQPNSIAYDGDGGVWMVQQRGTVGNPYPLAHINKNGEVDFKLTANTNNWFPTANITKGGSVAYDVKNQVVAMGGAGTVLLFQVKMVDGKPTLEKKIGEHVFKAGGTAEVNGLAFDYAGNLIALSRTSERFYHYTVPTDNNTCITPAKKSSTFDGAPVARVFAYGLNVVDNGNSYTFSFTPNASATTGRIVVYNGETKAQVAEFAISAPLTKGVKKEMTISKKDLPKLLGMTWAVELSGETVESLALLNNTADTDKYRFYRPQGVAIDNNPQSDFFGRMYIAYPEDNGVTKHKEGIVVFDPLHNSLKAATIKPTGVGAFSNGQYEMHRIAVNPTNHKVYYTKSQTNTAIYEMTPDATNILSDGGSAKNVISGISAITNANSLCFDKNGILYVLANATYDGGSKGKIYKVENGSATEFTKQSYEWAAKDNAIVSDGRGGFWVAQHRDEFNTFNVLAHINNKGEQDFYVDQNNNASLLVINGKNASHRGQVAYYQINDNSGILAFGGGKVVSLFNITYNSTGVPTVEKFTTTGTIGTNIDGLAFDYAGNLVVLSATSERFYHYTVPTNNNISLVPAKSTLTIDGEVGEVTYELNGGVWNEYGWSSKKDMYDAFISEWKAYEGPDATNRTTVSYDQQLGIGKSNGGIPTTIGTTALRDNLPAMFMHNDYSAKWGWLAKYMDVVAATQYKKMNAANGSKVQPTTNGAALTFSLGNFFGEDKNHTTDYIDAVDFTGEEAHLAAFQSVWGQTFPCVANPTEEITLNIPYKKGYRFDGWYKESDFSGSPVTKVDNTFKGTLYAKWTQSGIVYELNGGVWNEYGWTSKEDMYNAFLADWKAYSGSTRGTKTYEEQLGIGNSNAGIPTTIQESEDLLGFMAQEKWAWLGQFLDALATAQGKVTMPTEAIKQMRFGLGNFFGEDNNQATNWVGAVDCSGDIASITAFAPYWGQTFPLPTQPTGEVTLTAPYKEDYIFDGWYAAADFSGTKVTKVNTTSTGTLYAKWSVAPLYYELNGGVWNQYGWTSKKNMYDAFLADWKAYSGSTRGTIPYEDQCGIGKSNAGIPTTIQDSEPILKFMTQSKWGWLAKFLDALAAEQSKTTMPTAATRQMRYALGNFFGEDNNGASNWIGAVDCSGDIASLTAFAPYWGQTFPLPTQPTEEVTLTAPYKEKGYEFDGWYTTSNFSGAEVTVVDENTNGTLYAKWTRNEYTRSGLTSGRYGTICLPYNSNYFEGAIFYEVAWMNTSVSPWQVLVDEVTELEAGKPYIFMAKSNNILVACQGDAIADPSNHNGLYGTFTDINDGPAGTASNVLEGNHMLSNNQIMKCLGNCQLLANRAYFKLGEIPTVEPALVPGRRRVALGVQGGNEATGLDNLTEDGIAPAMEGTYDVLGRKMTETTNTGFYIVNGKKVVVVK